MTAKEFAQQDWDSHLEDDCRQLIRLAIREDLGRGADWTTLALAPAEQVGVAAVVTRQAGVACGLRAAETALQEMDLKQVQWKPEVEDGQAIEAGQTLAVLEGPVRHLLTTERLVLNLIGRLSGVARLTREYVRRAEAGKAKIYDTRKTTPGWRRLEKYAVRCGGGHNHRGGLYEAILIKDNHLEQGGVLAGQAVERARAFLQEMAQAERPELDPDMMLEVEVDTLDQLAQVLPLKPDIVLLDNMDCRRLERAVEVRDAGKWTTELEASGGVNLETVAEVSQTGVERISVGALTHSAVSLDVGLDWKRG